MYANKYTYTKHIHTQNILIYLYNTAPAHSHKKGEHEDASAKISWGGWRSGLAGSAGIVGNCVVDGGSGSSA